MLTLYVCGHKQELLDQIPNWDFLKKLNLNQLNPNNQLSESRAFLVDLELPTEYIGFITCNWGQKFYRYPGIKYLPGLTFSPEIVYAPHLTTIDWDFVSDFEHPGLGKYLLELNQKFNLPITGQSLYSNNFICHREVYNKFLKKWRPIFDYFHEKYGDNLDFECPDPTRKSGYLYERISTAVWASLTEIKLAEPILKRKGISNKLILKKSVH